MFFQKKELHEKKVDQIIETYPDLDRDNYNTAFYFFRAANSMLSTTDNFFTIYRLSQGRFFILQALYHNIANNNSTLAKEIGVTRPTITNLLKGLVEQELISFRHGEGDKRKITVDLTQKGRSRMEDILPIYYENINKFWGKLSSDEKKCLNKILYKLFYKGESE